MVDFFPVLCFITIEIQMKVSEEREVEYSQNYDSGRGAKQEIQECRSSQKG